MVAQIEDQLAKPIGPNGMTKPNHRKDNVRAWAPAIGIRAAARKFNVNEDTACFWAWKEKWILPDVFTPIRKGLKQASSNAHAAISEVIMEQGEDSRLYLSSAGLKASHEAAKSSGKALLTKETSQALLNTARSLDVTHGWTASRTAAPVVQIANVVMPTPEEKAERQAMFAKLEEITKRLSTPAA